MIIKKLVAHINLLTFCFALIWLVAVPGLLPAQQDSGSAFRYVKRISEKFKALPVSAIKPTGWLQQQLQENLAGFTGQLDSLAPDLVLKDDIYGTDRLTKNVQHKNVGAVADGGDWQVQFLWWNSETQSNWRDGYIRTAVLLNDKKHLQKIRSYVNKILRTQDADGYLGIYDKGLRYKFNNENGELWSKATLLRGLLRWYDFEKDSRVLNAVKRAIDNVMVNYPVNASHPFHSITPYVGGLSHGLAITDVFEQMYRLTRNRAYLDYCVFLYKDFSSQSLNEDAQYAKLINEQLALQGHAVHTCEHLRSVAAAYYASGNPAMKVAVERFLQKLDKITTPSGAPIGDEWIGGRKADATTTGYEYCSLLELMDAYLDLFLKTGAPSFAEKTERLFFNAAQGARHPTESAICYLKTDNSYELSGGKNGDTSDKKQTRYRYSPVHKEAAVCCVPNAGRITPAYIQHLWVKNDNNLVAPILGPCELNTRIKGVQVAIREVTAYPYDDRITLHVSAGRPVNFNIRIRKPTWADSMYVSAPYKLADGFIVLNRTWQTNDSVIIRFSMRPQQKFFGSEESYFMYGPFVLAHPLDAKEKVTKKYKIAGLIELEYIPLSPTVLQYRGQPIYEPPKKVADAFNWQFNISMFNSASGKEEPVILQPMGTTILRQVTFKNYSRNDR